MSRVRRLVAACAAALVVLPLATALPAAAVPALPTPVTAGAMPAPQTDGIVLAVAIVGDTVYVGGKFSTARPAGAAPGGPGEVARHNLLAFDLHTGELLPWAPQVSGSTFTSGTDPGPYCKNTGPAQYVCDTVFGIEAAPDGGTVYVGGDFDKIEGRWRSRIAAFDTATRELDQDFRPTMHGRVRDISVTADTVYAGGGFRKVNGVDRGRLAALGLDGTLLPWAPSADREVYAVLAAPQQGRVLIGGAFDHVNGVRRDSMMAVDASSGANVPWQARVPHGGEVVTDIVTDGSGTAYLSAYSWGTTNARFEGRAAIGIADGVARWWDGCYGDTQALAVSEGVLYSATHAHDCSAIDAIPENGSPFRYFRLTAGTTEAVGTATEDVNHVRRGDPIPELLPWFPHTDGGPADSPWRNGTWAIDAGNGYVVVGGEFTEVNGVAQQGLTRFAARGVPGAVHKGPQVPFRAPEITADPATGKPRISWTTTWDGQNSEIRYEVVRIGTSEPVHTVTQRSRPWDLPRLSYLDSAHDSGTYYIRAIDADGERIGSPQTTFP
ncbi:hypothetical protein [Amycolatopsis aidingensis]|uniref:hypothetical protein n=1 Tax=Amycolatopsis aidingensis TaxID=2842453 RepID=UPI001C0B91F3|nr:hypothetical protein [Amycolatopsis aidingensis]